MINGSARRTRIVRHSLWVLTALWLLVPSIWGADEKDLPAGPAKDLMITTCTACHSLNRILEAKHSKVEWGTTVSRMKSKGIDATDDNLDVILDYLQTNLATDK
jgi:hypothetical protein